MVLLHFLLPFSVFKKEPNTFKFLILCMLFYPSLEACGIFILSSEFWNWQWWSLGWINFYPSRWTFSSFNLEYNVYQFEENFLEYSFLFFFILSASLFILLFNLLDWTPGFLISSLLSYHFALLCLPFHILSSSLLFSRFLISATKILLESAHFYSLNVPFYSILFLFNGSNVFSYPLKDINNV